MPETVVAGNKSHPYGINKDYAYKVQKYRWRRSGFTANVWAGSSLSMSFDVPHLELCRVKTQRWLTQDRVVLLEFDYIYRDSVDTPGSLALLYDFERGELHSFDSASAWSVWPPEDRPGRKATREEFESLIHGYGPADRREPGIVPSPSKKRVR